MSLAGAAAFGVSSLVSGRTALEVKADGDPVTYIAMSADAFTNWDASWGSFEGTGATYWGGSFEALDTFFRGESAEGKTGTLTLKSWTQTTQYIYFQWGGAWADPTHQEVYLHFYCVSTTLNTDGELIAEKGGDPFVYENDTRNDTHYENKMLLKYFEIPEDKFLALGGANGFEMHIDLVDGRGADYGFHNFGYLHVNQTKEQVGDAMRYYLNHLNTDTSLAARQTIQGHYYGNSYLRNVFYATAGDITDGFDSQSDFTNHWYFDYTYFTQREGGAPHFDTAISDETVRGGDSQMPFNKTGTGFFRGWWEQGLNKGFIVNDTPTYRFISRPFVLSNDHPFVSIKMAGTASLHIIDATVDPGTTQAADLAEVDNSLFKHEGEGIVGERIYTGFNTCTLARHIINLQAYAGRTIQLAIADISDGSWGSAYFDELKVNIDVNAFKAESITQETTNAGTFYSVIKDVYRNSGHIDGNPNGIKYKTPGDGVTDTTDVKAAADYLASFYASTRGTGNHTTYCENLISDDMKGLVNTFNALGDGVKAIVAASDDFDQYDKDIADWFRTPVQKFTVEQTLNYIALRNGLNVENNSNLINSNFFGESHMWNYIALTAIIGAAAVLGFFLIKRRKAKTE